MILILLFIVIPAITMIFAVIADKQKAKFFFGMRPGESIYENVNGVNYYTEDKIIASTGILYMTNYRFVFFKYKYKTLSFIPFFGSILESIFIDKNKVFEIPVNNILTYQFQKTTYVSSRNRTVRDCSCAVTLVAKDHQQYKLNIHMADSKLEKPDILMYLDLELLGAKR